MRAANVIIVAVLAFAPMALAQTETAPPVEAIVEALPDQPVAPTEAIAPNTEEGATAEEAAVAAPAEPARVCRMIERSESRLRSRRERICRTQAEWDAQQQQRGNRAGAESDNN